MESRRPLAGSQEPRSCVNMFLTARICYILTQPLKSHRFFVVADTLVWKTDPCALSEHHTMEAY